MNEEIVIDGVNGKIVNIQDVQSIRDAVVWYKNNFLLDEYQSQVMNALDSAHKYSYPKVLSDYYDTHWYS